MLQHNWVITRITHRQDVWHEVGHRLFIRRRRLLDPGLLTEKRPDIIHLNTIPCQYYLLNHISIRNSHSSHSPIIGREKPRRIDPEIITMQESF